MRGEEDGREGGGERERQTALLAAMGAKMEAS